MFIFLLVCASSKFKFKVQFQFQRTVYQFFFSKSQPLNLNTEVWYTPLSQHTNQQAFDIIIATLYPRLLNSLILILDLKVTELNQIFNFYSGCHIPSDLQIHSDGSWSCAKCARREHCSVTRKLTLHIP